jgi:Lysozyme like domain
MTQLSFAQIEQLWVQNGGSTALAPVMAAVALAESGGRTDAHNGNAGTGDDSYGLWQINYFGSMMPGRSARYGTPDQLVADPNLQARAAVSLAGNGSGLSNWTTYTSGKYKAPLMANAGGLTGTSGVGLIGTNGAGSDIKLISDQVELGPLGKNPVTGEPMTGVDDTEGHWVIGVSPLQVTLQRSTFRKACSALVLVGGGAVSLLGAGLLVKSTMLQGLTSPITRALNQRGVQATALQKEQLRQEGLLQRQQERGQEQRRSKYETVDANSVGEEPF